MLLSFFFLIFLRSWGKEKDICLRNQVKFFFFLLSWQKSNAIRGISLTFVIAFLDHSFFFCFGDSFGAKYSTFFWQTKENRPKISQSHRAIPQIWFYITMPAVSEIKINFFMALLKLSTQLTNYRCPYFSLVFLGLTGSSIYYDSTREHTYFSLSDKNKKQQDMTVPFARARAKLGGSIC